MAKTFTAQNVASCNPLQFVWKEGELVDVICNVEVNYGEMGLNHQVSLWEDLTATQKNKAKAVYLFLKAKVEEKFLGE